MDSVDEMLAGLKEQQVKLARELARVERAIAALEGSLDESVIAASAAAPAPYVRLTLYEATAHYLASANEPRTSREIADALREGGFKTRSRRLPTTVATMLSRPEARYAGIRRTRDKKKWMYRPWRSPRSGSKSTS
jgi:hypothetical protein